MPNLVYKLIHVFLTGEVFISCNDMCTGLSLLMARRQVI